MLQARSIQRLVSASAAAALAGLLATPALAQQTPAPEPGSPAGEVVQTGTLAVSQLKLVNGLRISKLIGAAIYNEANEKIGTVDDLILTSEDKAVVAVIQVGGFLGAGGKLVAVTVSPAPKGQGEQAFHGRREQGLTECHAGLHLRRLDRHHLVAAIIDNSAAGLG